MKLLKLSLKEVCLRLEGEGFILINGIGVFNNLEFIHPDGRIKLVSKNWFYRFIISEE